MKHYQKMSILRRKYRRRKRHLTLRLMDRQLLRMLYDNKVKIIIVTGTIGKTSARVAISKVLANKYKVYFNHENHNAARPLRLQFFGLAYPRHSTILLNWLPILFKMKRMSRSYPYDVVVVELAESRARSLRNFIEKIKPDIAVITAITPVHMEYFKTIKHLQQACLALASPAKSIVFNADYPKLVEIAENKADSIGYGLTRGNIHFRNIHRNPDGYLTATLVIGDKNMSIVTKMIGRHALYSLLAAATVADQLGMSMPAIVQALATIEPVKGRMRRHDGINGSIVLDDSYNANLKSMEAALKTLNEFQGRKIAILGSMNGLGKHSVKHHQTIGQLAAGVVDLLIVFGDDARRYLAPAAIQAGLSPDAVIIAPHAKRAGDHVAKQLRPGDVVLVKGSEANIYAEEATKQLLADKTNLLHRMVRQQNFWRQKKKTFFKQVDKSTLATNHNSEVQL